MMSRTLFLIVFLLFFISTVSAQIKVDSLSAKFILKWNKQPLQLNKKLYSKTDSLEISVFKFYVSSIKIQFDDKSEFIHKTSYHLVDTEKEASLTIPICKTTTKIISKITFNIGVDSVASTSGALAGDLDATNGMYWAWQSGFINMKIEGHSNSCKTRKNAFQFHIGGYVEPNYALREIIVPVNKVQIYTTTIPIQVDLAKLFDAIQLNKINAIMIPGKEAMQLADLATKIFFVE